METASRFQRYLALAFAFRPAEAGAAHDLHRAYTRLFLGPGRPIAPPYESAYVEGRLAGEASTQVAHCYAEAGLQVVCRDDRYELPDHVAVELAFMAHLAAQEERDPGQAEEWRERQRRFLREHLTRWLPQFCQDIEASQAHPFYCDAARAAKRLVEEDRARLAGANWGLVKRYPNIRLRVDGSRCTLCSLCADNCRPGALTVGGTPTMLNLAFDPAGCNGCRACLRLCPEGAITIERGAALSHALSPSSLRLRSGQASLRVNSAAGAPPSTPASVLVGAPRVICPECHRPHIAEPWMKRLADRLGGGESVRRSLALCPFCKAALGEGLPMPVRLPHESFASV